MIYLTGK